MNKGKQQQQGQGALVQGNALMEALKTGLADHARQQEQSSTQLQLELQQLQGSVRDIGQRVGEAKTLVQEVQAVTTNSRREQAEGFTRVAASFVEVEKRSSSRHRVMEVAAQSMGELFTLLKGQEDAIQEGHACSSGVPQETEARAQLSNNPAFARTLRGQGPVTPGNQGVHGQGYY